MGKVRVGEGLARGVNIEAPVLREERGAEESVVADIGAAAVDLSTSDLDLVHRVQEQDDLKAYEILVKRYEKEAFALAYTLVGSTEDARDILQESFLNLYRSIKAFRGEAGFKTYFFRIVVNRCRDAQRQKRMWGRVFLWRAPAEGEEAFPEAVTHESPSLEMARTELGGRIETEMKNLPWRQRTIFALKFIEGMRLREIAELTGLSVGTVKAHLFHAVSKMRKALEEYLRAA